MILPPDAKRCICDDQPLPLGEKCPECGKSRVVSNSKQPYESLEGVSAARSSPMEHLKGVATRIEVPFEHIIEVTREFYEKHPWNFVINIVLAIGSSILGYFLSGLLGLAIGGVIGILLVFLAPQTIIKVREINRRI